MSKDEIMQVAEVRLIYKTKIKPSDRAKVADSRSAWEIFWQVWDHDKIEYTESFKAMFLNRANRVLGVMHLSEGGISGTVIDVRMILQGALKANASSVILAHNHPSGNTLPSESDKAITEKVREAGKLMDITLLDHLILTPGELYLSLSDECMM